MSAKEMAMALINQLPEHQVEKIVYIMQGMQLADDPFYSSENISELESRIKAVENGTSILKEHDLIEVE